MVIIKDKMRWKLLICLSNNEIFTTKDEMREMVKMLCTCARG